MNVQLFVDGDAVRNIFKQAQKSDYFRPAKGNINGTIVYGVNHKTLKASDTVISNAFVPPTV